MLRYAVRASQVLVLRRTSHPAPNIIFFNFRGLNAVPAIIRGDCANSFESEPFFSTAVVSRPRVALPLADGCVTCPHSYSCFDGFQSLWSFPRAEQYWTRLMSVVSFLQIVRPFLHGFCHLREEQWWTDSCSKCEVFVKKSQPFTTSVIVRYKISRRPRYFCPLSS
jgi:hypothetical protein